MGLSISARYITYLCTFWANAYALTLGGDKKIYGLGIRRKMWYGIMILRSEPRCFRIWPMKRRERVSQVKSYYMYKHIYLLYCTYSH
ncbi:hypothetical protein L211DRAFT_427036 [Terfezia boudieri ATCC MYA-4762]|uniref:Uncharacterized protein n=1 Tax=Terfezia boudieri ATCC MYA-4762 TaxID=1051890 RepID=A0A3N4LFZ8_9PEZI|nr:hypothetical protein L211DRAFT_427036 [Terfezia boudieri ATCC MYA-4762]